MSLERWWALGKGGLPACLPEAGRWARGGGIWRQACLCVFGAGWAQQEERGSAWGDPGREERPGSGGQVLAGVQLLPRKLTGRVTRLGGPTRSHLCSRRGGISLCSQRAGPALQACLPAVAPLPGGGNSGACRERDVLPGWAEETSQRFSRARGGSFARFLAWVCLCSFLQKPAAACTCA